MLVGCFQTNKRMNLDTPAVNEWLKLSWWMHLRQVSDTGLLYLIMGFIDILPPVSNPKANLYVCIWWGRGGNSLLSPQAASVSFCLRCASLSRQDYSVDKLCLGVWGSYSSVSRRPSHTPSSSPAVFSGITYSGSPLKVTASANSWT